MNWVCCFILLHVVAFFISRIINEIREFRQQSMDDVQMKELQDQLEAEQYFSVSIIGGLNDAMLLLSYYLNISYI